MTMTDFVLKTVQTPNKNEAICFEQTDARLNKIYQYALYLKQPLKLCMFIPCDKKGNVLKHMNDIYPYATNEEIIAWEEGLETIVFNGWQLNQKDISKLKNIICITKDKIQLTFFKKDDIVFLDFFTNNITKQIKTIEDLVVLQLTDKW